MSRVERVAQGQLGAGERPQLVCHGLSDGLNRASRNPGDAVMYITGTAIVVGWIKASIIPKPVAERFELSELMGVVEGRERLPGMIGTIERKNATKVLGRAMGASNTRPTVTLQTRRGDLSFFFKGKDLGQARSAYVAITDLMAHSR